MFGFNRGASLCVISFITQRQEQQQQKQTDDKVVTSENIGRSNGFREFHLAFIHLLYLPALILLVAGVFLRGQRFYGEEGGFTNNLRQFLFPSMTQSDVK